MAAMQLPDNPATPSGQNPGQQPASCRPAVGMRKASNPESGRLKSGLHLKRGPNPDPQESAGLNGRVLGFFRQINTDGADDVLSCFHLCAADPYRSGMALQSEGCSDVTQKK